MVQMLGRSCLLGKVDIKSAFRLLTVPPSDFHQLCYQWYADLCYQWYADLLSGVCRFVLSAVC